MKLHERCFHVERLKIQLTLFTPSILPKKREELAIANERNTEHGEAAVLAFGAEQ
jgi:hypothetical protein